MDKLRYKFKKIIRFINKILRLILIFGCLASFLTFSASAAVYVDKDGFYNVFGEAVEVQVECETGYQTETIFLEPYFVSGGSAYAAYIPSSYVSLTKLNMSFDGNASLGGVIKAGQYLIFKGNIGIRDRVDDSALINQLLYSTCKIVLSTDEKSLVLGTMDCHISQLDSYYYVTYDYDIKYTIPNDFDKYNNPSINFIFDLDANGTGLTTPVDCFIIKSTSMRLWFGDEEDAPIYPEYDNSVNENLSGAEEYLMNESQAGFDEFGTLQGDTSAILSSGSFLNGALFVTNIYNHFIRSLPWFNNLLKISLTLGLFVVLLTTTTIIGKRVK